MADENDQHRACVTVWMAGAARDATPAQLVALFERAIGALWRRAQVTLGDVTLVAIVERVLYTSSARFSALQALAVESNRVRFDELKARSDGLGKDELGEGIEFVMVELLTVLGHLTAEILTPALHAELSRVTLDDVTHPEAERPTELEVARKRLVRSS